jgi:O-methyltransferase
MDQVNYRDNYLDLLRQTLTFQFWKEPPFPIADSSGLTWKSNLARKIARFFRRFGLELCLNKSAVRPDAYFFPVLAHTMVSNARLSNIQAACETVDREGVAGDAVETGVWRGGASIFMRACLDRKRKVFVCDSFEGLPFDPSEPEYVKMDFLKVGLAEVKRNFEQFGQSENVEFVKGWFQDTLHLLPAKQFSIIRLDGDMYSSTMTALEALYSKLSIGGFCIIDDYCLPICARAVTEFRKKHHIEDAIVKIDEAAVYWRKKSGGK